MNALYLNGFFLQRKTKKNSGTNKTVEEIAEDET